MFPVEVVPEDVPNTVRPRENGVGELALGDALPKYDIEHVGQVLYLTY